MSIPAAVRKPPSAARTARGLRPRAARADPRRLRPAGVLSALAREAPAGPARHPRNGGLPRGLVRIGASDDEGSLGLERHDHRSAGGHPVRAAATDSPSEDGPGPARRNRELAGGQARRHRGAGRFQGRRKIRLRRAPRPRSARDGARSSRGERVCAALSRGGTQLEAEAPPTPRSKRRASRAMRRPAPSPDCLYSAAYEMNVRDCPGHASDAEQHRRRARAGRRRAPQDRLGAPQYADSEAARSTVRRRASVCR